MSHYVYILQSLLKHDYFFIILKQRSTPIQISIGGRVSRSGLEKRKANKKLISGV